MHFMSGCQSGGGAGDGGVGGGVGGIIPSRISYIKKDVRSAERMMRVGQCIPATPALMST